jgi:hypothetical protein
MCCTESSGETIYKNTVITDVRVWLDTFVFFVESELAPQTKYPILMGILTDKTIQEYKNTPCIIYNTEQLTRTFICSNVRWTISELCPVEVWDYSKANVDILRMFGVNARHIPLRTPKWYQRELQAYRKTGIFYDVGFAGLLTHRRRELLQGIEEAGLIVNVIQTFGEERDRELARCRVILNIHAGDDYNIFESARCEPWLSIGIPVISEPSLDDDPRCIITSYRNFVRTTIDTIRHLNSFVFL